MNIGLIAVDATKFPNLALMKLSAYHKAQGDQVEWANPLWGVYDRVYASKVFRFSPDMRYYYNCEIVKGGTGYDLHTKLPEEVDKMQPDYSLYPNIDSRTAYGFITRGCNNKCKWCVVPQKEGYVHPYMDIDEITQGGRRDKVILMDNNILACDYGKEQLIKIADKGYHIDLNQGNSAREIDEDMAKVFARIKWLSPIRFAADTLPQIAECERAMAMIDKYCKSPKQYLIYTMITGNLIKDYERLSHFKQYPKVRIIAQPFRDINNPHQVIPQ